MALGGKSGSTENEMVDAAKVVSQAEQGKSRSMDGEVGAKQVTGKSSLDGIPSGSGSNGGNGDTNIGD